MRLLLCLLLQLRAGRAADASKPHMNGGVNPPFASAKPQVSLTGSEETALAAGRTVMRQVIAESGKGGRALAVQDVAASPETVWNRILAFPEYPKMVTGVQVQPLTHAACRAPRRMPHASRLTPHASRRAHARPTADSPRRHCWQECSNYDTITHRNGTQTIRTRMKLGVMGVSLEYFIDHTYAPSLGVLTWTLDYSRLSDLIDSVGYWCVVPHPRTPGASRVFYSVDAALPSWVPGFVVNAVTKKALTDATSWVKVESEKAQARAGRGGGGGAPSAGTECKWSWKHMRRRCVEPPPSPPPPPPTWLAWATSCLSMVGNMVGAVSWYDVWLPATAKVCLLNAVALFSVALILRAAEAHR